MTSAELREQRAKIAKQMADLIKKDKLSPEDEQQFDKMDSDVNELRAKIDRLEKVETLNADLGTVRNAIGREERVVNDGNVLEVATQKRAEAFRDYCRYGLMEMDSALKPYLNFVQSEHRSALTTQTGSTGGYTVPLGFNANFVEILKSFNGVRQAPVSVMTTDSGIDLPTPVEDDTNNTGEILGENTATATNAIPTFAQVTLKAFMFSSKLILVPIQLLQDSGVNLDVLLPNMLGKRIGRIQATKFTSGSGSGEPQGIVTGASDSTVSINYDLATTYNTLVDLEHSVDPAYRADPSFGFMFHDSTLKQLKKLKDSQNRPLWLPGLAVKEPDTILSHPYTINQAMDASTLNGSLDIGTKPILAGAMSAYQIRDVTGVTLLRLNERFADSFQVGIVAYSRSDGRVLNSGAIKYATVIGHS